MKVLKAIIYYIVFSAVIFFVCCFALRSKVSSLQEKAQNPDTSFIERISVAMELERAKRAFNDLKEHRAYFLIYWPLAIKYTMDVYNKLN